MIRLIYISFTVLLFACNKESNPPLIGSSEPSPPPTKIILLKVDFVNRNFEGGKEINLSTHNYTKDSIPVRIDYRSPGDFGYIKLFYRPTNDTLFNGSIIWMGRGNIAYPTVFDTATKFKNLNYTINKPDSSRFQKIYTIPTSLNDTVPWTAINKLDVVRNYLQAHKKIGYFLYTPSVGVGDPAEWDWFFVLSK